jgi:hypothetical protein
LIVEVYRSLFCETEYGDSIPLDNAI